MTAALLVEAIAAIHRLGWALLVWIGLLAVAVTVALYAVMVAVGVPVEAACRALSGALAASRAVEALREAREALNAPEGLLGAPGSSRPPSGGPSRRQVPCQSAPQASRAPFPAPGPERASEGHLRPRTSPSWARKEAA